MESIYMNYAATSPGLSAKVREALRAYLENDQNLSAGRNFEGLEDSATALRARMALGRLFGVKQPARVVFTSGVTASLNMVLNGLVRPGDHVLATSLEHNAVARPLTLLQEHGVIEAEFVPCTPDGTLDPQEVRRRIRPNTRLLVMTHASNVLGTILPVAPCFAMAKQHGLYTVLDSAQTAGVLPVAMDENTDVVAFTGHKGLRGLAGSGGFAMGGDAAKAIRPWLVGGTGSASHSLRQPDFLPDKFEPGTPNTIGIHSLEVSVGELLETGVEAIREEEKALCSRFLDGASQIAGLTVYGTKNADNCVAVVSVGIPGQDAGILAQRLHDEHGVLTRSGLHCSPLAHRTAGTYPEGTVRFSFGPGTTPGQIDTALAALETLAR